MNTIWNFRTERDDPMPESVYADWSDYIPQDEDAQRLYEQLINRERLTPQGAALQVLLDTLLPK